MQVKHDKHQKKSLSFIKIHFVIIEGNITKMQFGNVVRGVICKYGSI